MTTVAELLSRTELPCSQGGRSESELLLAAALEKPRTYLIAWPEAEVAESVEARYTQWIAERRQGTPIAYILGYREFWSIKLAVNPDTLIPRPETELLVERLLNLPLPATARILDLGTGSGAIALALAHEQPNWEIVATDVSSAALTVAKENAARLALENVSFLLGSWFDAVSALETNCFDVIVSNPPYIDADDPHLQAGDLRYEPTLALTPGADGLLAYRTIAAQAPAYLRNNGRLLFEHGYSQGDAVRALLSSYSDVTTYCDLAGHERVTAASFVGDE